MLTLAAAALAAEPCSATAADVTETIESAQRALENLDPDRFVAETDRLDALLPCLAEPLGRHLAAEIHRTKGIRAVSERDAAASRYFAAARSLEPAYKLPSTLIPEGHPVRTAYAAQDVTKGTFEPVPAPAEGTLTLDAGQTLYRPTTWPTIAQLLAADGSVRFTAYLEPTTALPDYPILTAAPAPVPADPVPAVPTPAPPGPVPPPPSAGAPRAPLGVAALAGTALTGLLVGLAGAAEARFEDLETPDDELPGLRSRANSLVVASAFTGAASLGFGVAFVVVK